MVSEHIVIMIGLEMILEDLIAELELLPSDKLVRDGFGEPMSWRGSYDELAFDPVDETTIGKMLEYAKSADGSVYTGYKGGEFQMNCDTDVHIAGYGECGEPITSAHIKLWSLP